MSPIIVSSATVDDLAELMRLIPSQPFLVPDGQPIFGEKTLEALLRHGMVARVAQGPEVLAYWVASPIVLGFNFKITMVLSPKGLRHVLKTPPYAALHFGFQALQHVMFSINLPHQHPSNRVAQRLARQCGFVLTGVQHYTGLYQNQPVHSEFWELDRTAFYANPHHEYQDVKPLEKESS
jgi:hypothetical protein